MENPVQLQSLNTEPFYVLRSWVRLCLKKIVKVKITKHYHSYRLHTVRKVKNRVSSNVFLDLARR